MTLQWLSTFCRKEKDQRLYTKEGSAADTKYLLRFHHMKGMVRSGTETVTVYLLKGADMSISVSAHEMGAT